MAIDTELFLGKSNHMTDTENGMPTYETTGNPVLDLFFVSGAARGAETSGRVLSLIRSAIHADFVLTARLALWVRDIRGGAGERRMFRVILKELIQHVESDHQVQIVFNVLNKTAEVGRWDDLLYAYGTWAWEHATDLIWDGLYNENTKQLVAKWMPRQGPAAVALRKKFMLTPKEWRKMLVNRTNVVENKMCERRFKEIDFKGVPSLALARYSRAFERQAKEEYAQFLSKVRSGDVKINTEALYPYDVVKTLVRGDPETAEVQWENLPNYMEGSEDKIILPVVDTSGSMLQCVSGITTALDISVSLGLYLAERNEGALKDMFVTFSSHPEFQVIQGDSLGERIRSLRDAHWEFNTNIERTFNEIARRGYDANVSQKDMPDVVLIISDMEFDRAIVDSSRSTAMQTAKTAFEKYGYNMPILVFWNVVSRHNNFPVTEHEKDMVLISGFSPSIMTSVLQADFDAITPEAIMHQTLLKERYNVQ